MTQTTVLTYFDVMALKAQAFEYYQLGGLWEWEASGRLEHLEICSAEGHETLEECIDEACDALAICAEWGAQEGMAISDRTNRIWVSAGRESGTIFALSFGDGTRLVTPRKRLVREAFIEDCYGWDWKSFENQKASPVRIKPERWAHWLHQYACPCADKPEHWPKWIAQYPC